MRSLITVLCLLPTAVFAEQLHTFKNGEVADADDLNHNFGLIDQAGPVVEVSEFVVSDDPGWNGVNGTVMVTATDPSGVWIIDRVDSDGFYTADVLGVEGATTLQNEIYVQPQLNKSVDYYFYAEDFKGNKTVEKRTYTGPTTAIKAGRYDLAAPLDWSPYPCPGNYPVTLEGAELYVGVKYRSRRPELQYQLTLMHETFGDLTTVGYMGPNDFEASGEDQGNSVTVSNQTEISVNADSTVLTVTYTRTEACYPDNNVEIVGPFTFNFALIEFY